MPTIITRAGASLKSMGFASKQRNVAVTSVEYLVVAGGAGGGYYNGGGGAGGYRTSTGFSVTPGCTYTITVGAGGEGGYYTGHGPGNNGSNSVFSSITSTGGGGGGSVPPNGSTTQGAGQSGGSGGGGAYGSYYLGGSASPSGQGNAGGNGENGTTYGAGGGGGGAGAAGQSWVSGDSIQAGGIGLASGITGSSVYYAGGGGAGWGSGYAGGAGGLGGGGAGAGYTSRLSGVSGTTNTGGGGGGATTFAGAVGGNGGSGIVIVRYLGSMQYYTGGTVWASYDGYVVHSFTASGTLAPTTPVQLNPYPAVIGTLYGGGYFAGRITIGGTLYNLVVSPKASGYDSGISKPYKTSNTDDGSSANSYSDGMANSNAINDSNHPAVQFCRSLTIGGYSDWYLPSVNELEVIYNYLKPGTTATSLTPGLGGANPNAVAPELINTAYTTSRPLQTTAGSLWKIGGSESFEELIYITSTSDSSSGYARNQYFDNGVQWYDQKIGTNNKIRAIRKVAA